MEHQQQPQQQQPGGGILGPTGRRLHIAHRRSPSELTPLMSMFSSPGSKYFFLNRFIVRMAPGAVVIKYIFRI